MGDGQFFEVMEVFDMIISSKWWIMAEQVGESVMITTLVILN